MDTEISVSVGAARLENGAATMSIKIQTDICEVNIWIQEKDLPLLKKLDENDASWDSRDSIPIGQCANSTAFWSKNSKEVLILIGQDDESWDVGITLSHLAFRQILDGVRAESVAQGRNDGA
jgi:hypothetical protein